MAYLWIVGMIYIIKVVLESNLELDTKKALKSVFSLIQNPTSKDIHTLKKEWELHTKFYVKRIFTAVLL